MKNDILPEKNDFLSNSSNIPAPQKRLFSIKINSQ